MSTMGELYDRLKAIEEAESAIVDADISIAYGGDAQTMKGKHEILEYRKRELEELRAEPIIGEGE